MDTCIWDRKIGGGSDRDAADAELAGVVRYNETVTGLSPLDRPGSEAYFNAVMAALRREAEARTRSKAATVGKAVKVCVTKFDAPNAQRCEACGDLISGRCWAARRLPMIWCVECVGLSMEMQKLGDVILRAREDLILVDTVN